MKLETNVRLTHHNLAIMGGFLAGYTILNRIHFLGTAQTNNMINFILDICGRNWFDALIRFGAFACYILGTVLFVLVSKKTKWDIKYLSLIINLLAYLTIGLIPESVNNIIVWYPAFFAVSFQWNAFPGAYGYISSTIFSTNNIKQATLAMTEYLIDGRVNKAARHRGLFYITTFLCFEFGVFCSYMFTQGFGIRAIFFDGIFAIPAFFLIKNERKIAK